MEPWRKVLLTGAVLLLATSVLAAVLDDGLPGPLVFALNFIGYGLLAVGFLKRLRARDRP